MRFDDLIEVPHHAEPGFLTPGHQAYPPTPYHHVAEHHGMEHIAVDPLDASAYSLYHGHHSDELEVERN